MLDGKSRDIGLGAASGADAIPLAKARDHAIDLRRLVQAGIDPLQERDRAQVEAEAKAHADQIAAITLKVSAEAYIAAHSDSWRNPKHRAQWPSTLKNYVYPVMGDLPVGEITTEHVMAVIEPIWRSKPKTASRVRGRIETVLDAANARGHRHCENPARWRGHIALMLPARTRLSRAHHSALSYAQVPVFVAALRKKQAMAALALELTNVTAVRSGEVLGATWAEVDFENAHWTIPASRMKAGKEHRIPLSSRAVEILAQTRWLGSHYLFAGNRGNMLSNMSMAMLVRRMNCSVTVHGFRSAFRDWAAETTSYSHEVCEMALAHTISNKAEAAYRRGDLFEKRRELMAAWEQFCMGTPATSSAGSM